MQNRTLSELEIVCYHFLKKNCKSRNKQDLISETVRFILLHFPDFAPERYFGRLSRSQSAEFKHFSLQASTLRCFSENVQMCFCPGGRGRVGKELPEDQKIPEGSLPAPLPGLFGQ